MIAAVGGGQQQPGELAAGLAPVPDGAAGGGVGGRPLEERGLAAPEDTEHRRLAAPHPGIRRGLAPGLVERDRDELVSGRREPGQVVQGADLGAAGEQDVRLVFLHVRGLAQDGQCLAAVAPGQEQAAEIAQAGEQRGMTLRITVFGIERLVHRQRPPIIAARPVVIALGLEQATEVVHALGQVGMSQRVRGLWGTGPRASPAPAGDTPAPRRRHPGPRSSQPRVLRLSARSGCPCGYLSSG